MKKKRPGGAVELRDKNGRHWEVPLEPSAKLGDNPKVEVWWDKELNATEHLILRQEYQRIGHVAVMMLTQGQVYALIDALNKAIEG